MCCFVMMDVNMEMGESVKNISPTKVKNDGNLPPATLNFKKRKPGIIYLGFIPRYMTVKKVREYFSEFGDVTRLFLKPEKSKTGKPSKFFTEGWIEFSKRRIARQVAECLNGTQVGGKRHSPYYDSLWCIKYLKRFQWGQLSETKAFEKSRKEQKMRAEIAKVKKEIDVYTQSVAKSKRLKKLKDTKSSDNNLEKKSANVSQLSEIEDRTPEHKMSADERQSLLLKKIFGDIVNST